MKRMLDWLTWLLWTSEIVFLAASTPHIATYFEHFDNPTDIWSTAYAWAVGYGLALTIDGVTFVILMSLVVAIKFRRPWWLTSFLVFSLLLISSLSWFINWQYDIVFRSSTFAKADGIQVHLWSMSTSVGNLNPLIGGAFPLLSVLYALVAKALEVDEGALTKTAMTPEQFENEKLRVHQEQELKALKASGRDGKGLLAIAQETVIGKPRTSEELLNSALSLLREATDLLQETSQEQALQALAGHLKISNKQALALLIEARSVIRKEEEDRRMEETKREHEERLRQAKANEERRMEQARREEEDRLERERADREAEIERARLEHEAAMEYARLEHEQTMVRLQAEREERIRQERADQGELLSGLAGNATISLEEAGTVLGYDTRYITRLRNEGKLKHSPRRDDQITVASIRAYQANHKRRKEPVATGYSNGHKEGDTDPLGLPVLSTSLE